MNLSPDIILLSEHQKRKMESTGIRKNYDFEGDVQGGLTGQTEGPGSPEAQVTEARINEIANLRWRVTELETEVSFERSRLDRAEQQVHQSQEATRQAEKRAARAEERAQRLHDENQKLRKQIAAAQAQSSVRGSSHQLSSDMHHDQDDRDSDAGGSETSVSRQVLAEHEEPTQVQVALEEPGQSNRLSLPGLRKRPSTLPFMKTTSARYTVSQRFSK